MININDIGSLATSIRETITGKKIKDTDKLLIELAKLEAKAKENQTLINNTEAKHKSLFVSGARPFILWISGVSVGYSFILQPFIVIVLKANSVDIEPPTLDMSVLMTLMTGMLGFGAMRSYDKKNGVAL